jgi:hypothetical protein
MIPPYTKMSIFPFASQSKFNLKQGIFGDSNRSLEMSVLHVEAFMR